MVKSISVNDIRITYLLPTGHSCSGINDSAFLVESYEKEKLMYKNISIAGFRSQRITTPSEFQDDFFPAWGQMGSDRFNHWEFGIVIRLMNKVHTYRHQCTRGCMHPHLEVVDVVWKNSKTRRRSTYHHIFAETSAYLVLISISKNQNTIMWAHLWLSGVHFAIN